MNLDPLLNPVLDRVEKTADRLVAGTEQDPRPSETHGPALVYITGEGAVVNLTDPRGAPEHPILQLGRLDRAQLRAALEYATDRLDEAEERS